MGLKMKRSSIKHDRYNIALVLLAALEKCARSTLAANRLLIMDPRGKIPEADLFEFLETVIEPQFWPWLKKEG